VINSMDEDGVGGGYDIDLLRAITEAVNVPVIASGGPIGGDVQHAAPAREPQGRRPVRSRRRRLQSGWEKIGEHSAWG